MMSSPRFHHKLRVNWMLASVTIALAIPLSGIAGTKIDEQATSKDAETQFSIGRAYFHGDGVEKDDIKALEFFKLAAAQGYAKAEHNLGVMYLQGSAVNKDEAIALSWFKKAAEQSVPESEDTVGQMYLSGTGTKKDCREAIRWFQKAAEKNYVEAELHLGRLVLLWRSRLRKELCRCSEMACPGCRRRRSLGTKHSWLSI